MKSQMNHCSNLGFRRDGSLLRLLFHWIREVHGLRFSRREDGREGGRRRFDLRRNNLFNPFYLPVDIT